MHKVIVFSLVITGTAHIAVILTYVIDDSIAEYSEVSKVFLLIFCYIKNGSILICTSSFAYVLARYSKD